MWNEDEGRRLAHQRIHGAVVHLLLEDQKLYAVSDLGQTIVWDLKALYVDYCTLLEQVWQRVPVEWHHGRPVLASPPTIDRCAKGSSNPSFR